MRQSVCLCHLSVLHPIPSVLALHKPVKYLEVECRKKHMMGNILNIWTKWETIRRSTQNFRKTNTTDNNLLLRLSSTLSGSRTTNTAAGRKSIQYFRSCHISVFCECCHICYASTQCFLKAITLIYDNTIPMLNYTGTIKKKPPITTFVSRINNTTNI